MTPITIYYQETESAKFMIDNIKDLKLICNGLEHLFELFSIEINNNDRLIAPWNIEKEWGNYILDELAKLDQELRLQ